MEDDLSIAPPEDAASLARFGDIASRSLNFPADRAALWFDRAGTRGVRLARRGAEVVGGYLSLPMKGLWIAGRAVPCVGISGVAVAPEHRSRGVAGAMMRVALEEARREGQALASLYPATFPVYRAAGYEVAGTRFVYRLALSSVGSSEAALDVREARPADPALPALYEASAREGTGAIARTPYFWTRIHEPFGEQARAYVVEGDAGAEGYVVLWYKPSSSPLAPAEIPVRDAVARTPRAARRILRLLADHRSVAATATFAAGPGHTLLGQMTEPRLQVAEMQEWMLRVVDVRAVIEQRGWSPAVRGELHLDVRDALLRDNARRWVVEVEGGRAAVREGGRGSVNIDVRGLASLLTGYRTGDDLRVAGLADGPEAELATASALFAGPASWSSDMF